MAVDEASGHTVEQLYQPNGTKEIHPLLRRRSYGFSAVCLGPSALWRVAGVYACWAETGKRWARLIGYRPMLSRVR